MNSSPLADRIRPQSLDDVVGQEHLLARGKALRKIIDSGEMPNMIFYGPSGVGKSTVASIIAEKDEPQPAQAQRHNGVNRRHKGDCVGA